MKIVSTATMQDLDRRATEAFGVPGAVLMERAGQRLALEALALIRTTRLASPAVLLIAGKGNNGGDAFVAARALRERGVHALCWLAGKAADLKGDPGAHFKRMIEAGVPFREMATDEAWASAKAEPITADVVVDAVLGTGCTGAARGLAAAAIEYIRIASTRALVLSADVPSGLDSDTGVAQGAAVQADVTVTFGLPKAGLTRPDAIEWVGCLKVADIGLPQSLVEQAPAVEDMELIEASEVRAVLPRRVRASHKGRYGRVLLVGGSAGYTGAMTLAASAALRSGAGLVHVIVPKSLVSAVATRVPSAMVQAGPETAAGTLSSDVWSDLRRQLESFDALLIGPGLTRGSDALVLVKQLLRECRCPLVLDADAISVLQGQPDAISHSASPVVLTPHEGEFARLFDQEVEQVRADRTGMAMAGAKLTGAVVVLKGAGTLVAQRDRPVALNLTGNPGMATGGSGDVLAGMLTAFLGQGLEPWAAACAAVYVHGRAGDLAALQTTQACMESEDLLRFLPHAFREFQPR